MLTIYENIDDAKSKEIITDVEKAFNKLKLKETDTNKKLIEVIEQGKWNDEHSFIDRFGFKLYNSELSTGCKAALVVNNNPDAVVDLRECGLNARDAIINLCRNGGITLRNEIVTIVPFENNKVDIKMDNYRFSTIDRLNDYIQDERPFKPDLTTGGIELCTE